MTISLLAPGFNAPLVLAQLVDLLLIVVHPFLFLFEALQDIGIDPLHNFHLLKLFA